MKILNIAVPNSENSQTGLRQGKAYCDFGKLQRMKYGYARATDRKKRLR